MSLGYSTTARYNVRDPNLKSAYPRRHQEAISIGFDIYRAWQNGRRSGGSTASPPYALQTIRRCPPCCVGSLGCPQHSHVPHRLGHPAGLPG